MVRRVVPLCVVALLFGLAPARALDLEPIPAERPWLIFRAPAPGEGDTLAYADHLKDVWSKLAEPLRPLSALEIPGPLTGATGWGDRLVDIVNELQFAEIPTVLAITNSPQTAMPIDKLRALFDQFTILRGVHVSGLHFDEFPDFASGTPMGAPPQAAWLASVIELAAQYSRRVVIELDGLAWIDLMANTRNKIVLDKMREYPAVVVPMNGQHGPHSTVASSATMGLWLEGAAAQWGLASDSGWYAAAAFVEPGLYGLRPGVAMPPAFYRAMLLNGAMAGATVYRYPIADDLWAGAQKHYWDEVLEPTLRELVDKGFIARKDLVQEKAHVAYRLNAASSLGELDANLDDLDPLFHMGRLPHGAYGLESPGQVTELILNTGQFYWIPVLSPNADDAALQRFKEIVLPGALLDASAWRERLLTHYQIDGEGNAFIARVGRGYFVMHTHENLYEEQSFKLAAVPAPVRGVSARRAAEGTQLSWSLREGDVFYRIYRRELPAGRWTQVSGDIDALSFVDTTPPDSTKTIAYAVTALTSEMEPMEGTVNFGDYLVINAVESRIVEQAVLEPSTNATTSVPPPPTTDARPAKQEVWPDLEDLTGDQLFAAQGVVAQLNSLEVALRNGDAAAAAGVYAPGYADAAGWSADYVRAAYGLYFTLFRPGPVHRQIRAWDFTGLGVNGKDARVTVRVYWRMTGQRRDPAAARMTGGEVALPPSPTGEVDFTFVKTGEQWLLSRTEPALPRLEDFFPSTPPTP